jgi:hypothetical protein
MPVGDGLYHLLTQQFTQLQRIGKTEERRTIMIRLTVFLFLCLYIPNAGAMETLRSVEWNEVKGAGELTGGEAIQANDPAKGIVLRIDKAGKTSIFTMEHPGISKPVYALTGEVSYENVEGDGYIEMMHHFPGGERFIFRTLAS